MSHPLVEELVGAVERRDADAYAALFAEGAVAQHPLFPEPLVGREAIKASEEELFASFSDVEVEVRSAVADEGSCVIETVLRATNTGPLDLGGGELLPPTGRRIELAAVWWYDVGADGRITGARDYFDTAALMSQLGLADAAAGTVTA